MRKLALLVLCISLALSQVLAQSRTISGKVTDSNGSPLVGATVTPVGGSGAATTNATGAFTINVPASTRQLEVSYVGFTTQTITLGSQTNVTVKLAPSVSLENVVVTGITRVKKSEYAGASSKITIDEIQNKPVGSFDQIFQGRVPGVLALTSSGQPGAASTVIIRGQGSITGGFTPLYVVDGIPVEASVFQGLNPNDFESIDVLRDASATALYGSRGSAGVIVVTTKRGKSGKARVAYSGQYGIKQRPNFIGEMMTTAELLKAQEDYGRVLNLPQGQSGNIPGWYYSKLNPTYATLSATQKAQYDAIRDSISQINTDWRDVFLRDGQFTNHQIELSGGSDRTTFRSSLSYYSEEGTTLRTDMKRVSWMNNFDYNDNKLTFRVSSNLSYVKRNFQQSATGNNLGNPFLVANVTTPYSKAYNADGSLALPTVAQYQANSAPYAGVTTLDLTNQDKNYNDQVKLTLSFNAAYKVAKNVTAALTTGIDFRETQTSNYGSRLALVRQASSSITGRAGFQSEALTRFFSGNIRPSIGYSNTFNKVHDMDVTVYGEYVQQYSKSTTGTGYGIDPRTPNTPAAITQGNGANQLYAVVGGGKGQNAILSGLVIGRYTYNKKYTLNLSYRSDGSSKLPEVNRWTSYYSIGAIWDASRENFMSNISRTINTLRVKASYGGSGNHNNFPGGDYPYQASYGNGSYGGLVTQVATYPGNDDLMWESTWVTNIGIDFGFLRNRIWGDVNLYDKRTKDLFVQKTLAATSGFGSLDVNAGELQNKGVELVVNADAVRNKNVTWTFFGNFAYNKNKVLDLGGEPSFEQGTELITVGMPLGSHYEVKWGGVDAATGRPLYYAADGKLTNNYNNGVPVQEFGTWEAPWKGGFGSSVRVKSFEISTVFSWQKGANKVDNMEYFTENPVGFLANGYNQAQTMRFWQKPGDVVSTPSPLYSTNFSSKIIHKADFLRWRDLTISMNLPNTLLSKTKFISRARVYVQATNLLIWTEWRGMDPEAGATNLNLSEYPNPRAITGGIDITF